MACVLAAADPAPSRAETLSLDSCRAMALSRNKQLRISRAKVDKARQQKSEAKSAYFPSLDFSAAYVYNQKNISLFDSDQLLPTKSFDMATQSYEYNLVKNPVTGEPVVVDGHPLPSTVAVMPKEALTYDIHNIFMGAVTLTQPIFMGGKIVAMNKLTGYAEQAAAALADNAAQDVIVEVDAMYWQVVSLKAKERLAVSYVNLLDTLLCNVRSMVREGVATRSDELSVEVKHNSAQVDLVKVRDGLSLSRMALNRLIGRPLESDATLADEDPEAGAPRILAADVTDPTADMPAVYARRSDVRALELQVKARNAQADVARSSLLPQLAAFGAYSFGTPNSFDGFKNRIGGMFSVGAMLKVPLWHWGGDYAKYRAAKAERTIAELELEDAREQIRLQVAQCGFKVEEARRTHAMTQSNIAKADENLRSATLGYREGVMTLTNVLEAQTAWLKAQSENIDAAIDVRLCDVYLLKAMGMLPAAR